MKYFVLYITLVFVSLSQAENKKLNIQDLPQETLQGTRPDLAKKTPKLMLIDFWASWCGPCRESLPYYNKLQKIYAAKDVQFLAINVDEEKSDALEFMKEVKIDFPVLRDGEKKFAKQLKLEAIPSLILVDKNLNIVEVERGYNSKKAKSLAAKIESLVK